MFHRRIFSSTQLSTWELASITGGVKCNKTNACKILMCKSHYIFGAPIGAVFTSKSLNRIEWCYEFYNKILKEYEIRNLRTYNLRVGNYEGGIIIPEYVKSGDIIVLQLK